jgi:flagellar biosynthesis protein FlhG
MTGLKRGRVVAVTSGKGGVGKTSLAVNVAIALARMGQRVAVVDGNYGLGNVDVMLGLTPVLHLGHLLSGERALNEIALEGPAGVSVVPAGSGVPGLTTLSAVQRGRLRLALDRLRESRDFVLVDTATGIADSVLDTVALADRVLVVTSLDPPSVVDAYATVKVLSSVVPTLDVGIVVNGVRDGEEASLAFRQLEIAANRFLTRAIHYYGYIPDDGHVREAVLTQRAVIEQMPHSAAGRAYRTLAIKLAGFSPTSGHTLEMGTSLSGEEISRCA